MYGKLSLRDGIPIGRIVGGRYDGKKIRISTTDEKNDDNEYLIKDEGKIIPLFFKQSNGFNRWNCAGPTLCGKSYHASKIAEDYQKQYPKNRIVLFTAIKDEDKNFEKIKKMYRIDCDQLVDDPIDLSELKDSLCIFDDINSFKNKDTAKYINTLRDNIMSTGRHDNIDCITINQLLLDGHLTKSSLLNTFQIIAFPNSGGRAQLTSFLKRYMSLDNQLIDRITHLPSRWIAINRVNPNYVLFEKGVFMI